MNYLRRRFSDPNAMGGLPNGYFQNIGVDGGTASSPPSSGGREGSLPPSPQPPKRDTGFLSSFTTGGQSSATGGGNVRQGGVIRCKTLLIVDDAHTDW